MISNLLLDLLRLCLIFHFICFIRLRFLFFLIFSVILLLDLQKLFLRKGNFIFFELFFYVLKMLFIAFYSFSQRPWFFSGGLFEFGCFGNLMRVSKIDKALKFSSFREISFVFFAKWMRKLREPNEEGFVFELILRVHFIECFIGTDDVIHAFEGVKTREPCWFLRNRG